MPNYGWGKMWKDNYVNHGCPCTKNCPNRKQGCHAECQAYIEWFKQRDIKREEIHEKKKVNSMFGHYYGERKK